MEGMIPSIFILLFSEVLYVPDVLIHNSVLLDLYRVQIDILHRGFLD